jgi:hypothetical protein
MDPEYAREHINASDLEICSSYQHHQGLGTMNAVLNVVLLLLFDKRFALNLLPRGSLATVPKNLSLRDMVTYTSTCLAYVAHCERKETCNYRR